MESLRPISAMLISMEPRAGSHFRRRLLLAEPTAAAIQKQVRITRISTSGCVIADCGEAPAETALVWLRLPGKEPARVVVAPLDGGGLACDFVQPLYPSELQALLAYGPAQGQRSQRLRPRCTLL